MGTLTSPTVWLVTGSNRGIGLEFVKQILAHADTSVIAGTRSPQTSTQLQEVSKQFADRLLVLELDLSNTQGLQVAVEAAEQRFGKAIDYLINNAGVLGDFTHAQDQDLEDLKQVVMTNVIGTFAVTKAFLPMLKQGRCKTIINMSSDAACLTENFSFIHNDIPMDSGMGLSYKVSKAAINMETTVLANDTIDEGFRVVSLHPGFVFTDMGNAASKAVNGLRGPSLTAVESVNHMMHLILGLVTTDSGKYFLYDGSVMPW